jgi:hypothetical protein
MKKIKITEKSGASIEYINDGEVINRLHLMGHGLPERIVADVEGSYDPADVIEHIDLVVAEAVPAVLDEQGSVVTEEVPAVIKKQVKLKPEYTIEIIDMTQEYALEQCIANRKAEYPTMEDFLNAYFDGGEVAVQILQAQRLAVKAKFPKP